MNKKKSLLIIYDNLKTLIGALIIAILIRSLIIQPFYIPSSSMEPTLLIEIEFLFQSILTATVNTHFRSVQIFQIIASFQKS